MRIKTKPLPYGLNKLKCRKRSRFLPYIKKEFITCKKNSLNKQCRLTDGGRHDTLDKLICYSPPPAVTSL